MALAAGNQLLLAPAAANALPGDALYPVKRLNEQLAYVLTFQAEQREALKQRFSGAERAAEVALLEQAQREAEVTDWEVVLRSLEEPRGDDEPGMLHVRTIVDDDDDFLDEAKRLFDGRVPTVRTLADAQRSVEEGNVDLVFLGPSFAHETGLQGVGLLLELDPDLAVVLVAGTITAPLLRSAMQQ